MLVVISVCYTAPIPDAEQPYMVDRWVLESAQLMNQYRDKSEPFCLDSRLLKAAKAHAEYIVKNSDYDHIETEGKPGFTGTGVLARAKAQGFNRGVSENINKGCADDFKCTVNAWVNSKGHLKNIQKTGYTRFGIAKVPDPNDKYNTIWVMMTGKSDGDSSNVCYKTA